MDRCNDGERNQGTHFDLCPSRWAQTGISLKQRTRKLASVPRDILSKLCLLLCFCLWCSPLCFLSAEEVWLDGTSVLSSEHAEFLFSIPHQVCNLCNSITCFCLFFDHSSNSEFGACPLQYMLFRVTRTDSLSSFKRDLREISQLSWQEAQIQHLHVMLSAFSSEFTERLIYIKCKWLHVVQSCCQSKPEVIWRTWRTFN